MKLIETLIFNHIIPTISQSILTLIIILLIVAIFPKIHPRYKIALYSLVILKPFLRFLLGSPYITKNTEAYTQSQPGGLFIYIPDPAHLLPFQDFVAQARFTDVSYFKSEIFLIFLIICIGILIFLIYRWVAIHFFYNQLSREKVINPNRKRRLYDFVQHACKELKIKNVRLLESIKISSPYTVGIINPTIIFPHAVLETLTESEIQQVALHEIMHVKRRDSIKKWILTIIGDLLFFAPPIYLARKKMSQFTELDCDFRTIAFNKNPKDLAKGIFEIAKLIEENRLPKTKSVMISSTFFAGSSSLKHRIISFSNSKKLTTKIWKSTIFFIFYSLFFIYQISWVTIINGRQITF